MVVAVAAACGLGAVALGGLNGLSLATSESRMEGIVPVPTVFRAAPRPPHQRKAATGAIPALPATVGATARPPAEQIART
jgi:hypothetical protein